MKEELSRIQIRYLKKLRKLQEENIYNDKITVRMIAKKVNKAPSTTWAVLKNIAKKGYLERTEQGIYIIKNIDLDKV